MTIGTTRRPTNTARPEAIGYNPRSPKRRPRMPTTATPPSVEKVLAAFDELYPEPRYALQWETPLQLVIATILASQCSDERVNSVTPALFALYRTAADFVGAKTEELEELIK